MNHTRQNDKQDAESRSESLGEGEAGADDLDELQGVDGLTITAPLTIEGQLRVSSAKFNTIAKICARAERKGWSVSKLDACIRRSQAIANLINPDLAEELRNRKIGALSNLGRFYGIHYTHTKELSSIEKSIAADEEAVLLINSTPFSPSKQEARSELISHLALGHHKWRKETGSFLPPLREGVLDPDESVGDGGGGIGLPEHASWLFALARTAADPGTEEDGESSNGHNSTPIPTKDLELCIGMTYEALEITTPHHTQWEDMVNAARDWQRLWSAQTGKIPDTEIATLLFRKGARWVPGETEHNPTFEVPHVVSVGDLDAPPKNRPVIMPYLAERGPVGGRRENQLAVPEKGFLDELRG